MVISDFYRIAVLKVGNRTRKLPEETLVLMEKFILDDYETLKQKKMWEVHSALVRVCEQQGAIAPSYKAFTKEMLNRVQFPFYNWLKMNKTK